MDSIISYEEDFLRITSNAYQCVPRLYNTYLACNKKHFKLVANAWPDSDLMISCITLCIYSAMQTRVRNSAKSNLYRAEKYAQNSLP